MDNLILDIRTYYNEFEYDRLIVDYVFTLQGSYNFIVRYKKNNEYRNTEVSNKPIRNTVREMADKFEEQINSVMYQTCWFKYN